MDTDKDGKLSEDEWVAMGISKCVPEKAEKAGKACDGPEHIEHLKNQFNGYDTNNNGFIEQQEVQGMVQIWYPLVGKDENMMDEEVVKTIRMAADAASSATEYDSVVKS